MHWSKNGKNEVDVNDVLIFDIETWSDNDIDNFDQYVGTAVVKWFGAYSYKHRKFFYYRFTDKDKIQKLIDEHSVLVGFNSNSFDIPILLNNQYNLNYKIRLDLMRVLWNPEKRKPIRANIIRVGGKNLSDILPDYKLRTIGELLKLSVPKGDIDYKIFKRDDLSDAEILNILEYLHADIVLTKELFEFLYKEFLPLKEYMKPEDQKKYEWMRTSTGGYTYKVICYGTGMEEKYPEGDVEHEKYEGGFVALPTEEESRGNIVGLDFTSAYPHAFLMGNLYSHSCECCTEDEKWGGNDLFPVKGKYCSKKMGKIEETIKILFAQRLEYKKNKDPREYAVKIILNTMYGISGSPLFSSLYNSTTASDCTLIARQMIKHARKKFHDNGYRLLYTDTDSVFLEDIFDDEEKLLRVRDEIIIDIKKNLPFPQSTFNMSIDEKMKVMWFFRNKSNEFSKKFYVYLTRNNKLKLKGVPIVKSTCSKVSKEVYKILEPLMIEREDIKFDKEFIKKTVFDIIQNDMGVVAKLYKVKRVDQYSISSCLHAQISKVLGAGNHLLVPNSKIGIGKSIKKYATIEQAKSLKVDDLFLNDIFDGELSIFIKDWHHPEQLKRMNKLEMEKKNRSIYDF